MHTHVCFRAGLLKIAKDMGFDFKVGEKLDIYAWVNAGESAHNNGRVVVVMPEYGILTMEIKGEKRALRFSKHVDGSLLAERVSVPEGYDKKPMKNLSCEIFDQMFNIIGQECAFSTSDVLVKSN